MAKKNESGSSPMQRMAQAVIDVEIQGIVPLLQNNIEGAEGVGNRPKSPKRNTGGIKDNPDEWRYKTYPPLEDGQEERKEGLGHIGTAVDGALARAARDFKADKRRSMADVVKALVYVNEPMITLVGKTKPDGVNRASSVNPATKGRGFTYRPMFNQGWVGRFSLTVADTDVVAVDKVKEILDYAGYRIGIGDWRPKFGRFYVSKFAIRN